MSAFPPVRRLTSIAAPLLRDNVDTDAIIPSREIRSTGKTGLADGLFAGWRYHPGGREPRSDFVLNQPAFGHAEILVAGANFGSGSSREHAVWALHEWGVRAIVAASFAPIFFRNCIRNGIAPAALPYDAVLEIAAAASADPTGNAVTVDVERKRVSLPDGRNWSFDLDEESRAMLLEGLDAIDLSLKHKDEIAHFHVADRAARPWVYFGDAA